MIQNDELLDLVNDQDEIIGQALKSTIYKKNQTNFRVINGFIVNSHNLVWIPRRSPEKKLFPLCLDTSVGGHVQSGETYDEAFKREVHEELNLNIDEIPCTLIGKLTPQSHYVSAFMHLYLINIEEAPCYNKNDFVSAQWYELPTLLRAINQGERTKGDLPILLSFIQKKLNEICRR